MFAQNGLVRVRQVNEVSPQGRREINSPESRDQLRGWTEHDRNSKERKSRKLLNRRQDRTKTSDSVNQNGQDMTKQAAGRIRIEHSKMKDKHGSTLNQALATVQARMWSEWTKWYCAYDDTGKMRTCGHVPHVWVYENICAHA